MLVLGRPPGNARVEGSTQVGKYVNFPLLKRQLQRHDIGSLSLDRFVGGGAKVGNDTCVFNRGVVLFDPLRPASRKPSRQ